MPPPNDVGIFPSGGGFYEVLTAAISDIADNGFDSLDRVSFWVDRIRGAAIRSMVPVATLERALNETMRSIYRAKIERGGILRQHPGVSRFTLAKVQPRLRAELDRRIMASASLIKLNRAASVEKMVQRFSGWATSIPDGGSDAVNRRETKAEIRKALASLPFAERRVAVDQGHKFVANLNNIIAVDGGAIALVWHSHAGELGYNARPSHAAREGLVYLIRDNWASEHGFVKPGEAGYYDDVTAVGEEVFCRCWATYLYALRRLPDAMLTEKGRAELERVRLAA